MALPRTLMAAWVLCGAWLLAGQAEATCGDLSGEVPLSTEPQGAVGPAAPLDPVIEEPIRSLLPAGQQTPDQFATPCGPTGPLMLPIGLLCLCAMRWMPARATSPSGS